MRDARPVLQPIGERLRYCALASTCSTCFGALPLPMAMVRGFSRSGTLRTRSTWSRPSLRSAPFTSTWSARRKRRSNARVAMPRCRNWRSLLLGLLLAAHVERLLLDVDLQLVLAEAGHRHGDPVLVLAEPLDVVGRIGGRAGVEAGHAIQHVEQPVEADGGAIEGGKIDLSHHKSSLGSDVVLCLAWSQETHLPQGPGSARLRTPDGHALHINVGPGFAASRGPGTGRTRCQSSSPPASNMNSGCARRAANPSSQSRQQRNPAMQGETSSSPAFDCGPSLRDGTSKADCRRQTGDGQTMTNQTTTHRT